MSWMNDVEFDERGLVPVVAQDAGSGEVLMLAWANAEALRLTAETGLAHYWSRSRRELWAKGATSGHVQEVVDVRLDCDADAVLYRVRQTGPACHTGARSCFHRAAASGRDGGTAPDPRHMAARLEAVLADRAEALPEGSYTTYLFREGVDKILKKVGEEAAETIVAAKNDDPEALASEAADLVFHLAVLMQARGSGLSAVWAELERRFGAPPRPGSAAPRPGRGSDAD
jgi:phosphoribosyl-AMP cyclohydrolase / phosphoribosyl-ATP pyrophosphohydrolase